jgi:protein tyrosine phosphatase
MVAHVKRYRKKNLAVSKIKRRGKNTTVQVGGGALENIKKFIMAKISDKSIEYFDAQFIVLYVVVNNLLVLKASNPKKVQSGALYNFPDVNEVPKLIELLKGQYVNDKNQVNTEIYLTEFNKLIKIQLNEENSINKLSITYDNINKWLEQNKYAFINNNIFTEKGIENFKRVFEEKFNSNFILKPYDNGSYNQEHSLTQALGKYLKPPNILTRFGKSVSRFAASVGKALTPKAKQNPYIISTSSTNIPTPNPFHKMMHKMMPGAQRTGRTFSSFPNNLNTIYEENNLPTTLNGLNRGNASQMHSNLELFGVSHGILQETNLNNQFVDIGKRASQRGVSTSLPIVDATLNESRTSPPESPLSGRRNQAQPPPPIPPPYGPITHYWYRNWPDHGVPANVDDFRNFLMEVYNDMVDDGGNTVIHCSAGVGRTGVMYICLLILQKLMNGTRLANVNEIPKYNNVELFKTNLRTKLELELELNESDPIITLINFARRSRMLLVQTENQHLFIHNVFLETQQQIKYLETEDTPAKVSLEYKTLPKVMDCKLKNRYSDILPYPFNTAKTRGNPTVFGFEDCATYINASIMHINKPGSKTNVFGNNSIIITAQGPKDNTIQDFLQMLKAYKVKRVIMLTGLKEGGRIKCSNYLGNNVEGNPNLQDTTDTQNTKFNFSLQGEYNNITVVNATKPENILSEVAVAVGGRRLTRKSRQKSHRRTHKSKHTRKNHKSKSKRLTKKH